MLLPTLGRGLILVTGAVLASRAAAEAPRPVKVSVEWDAVDRVSRTTATLQVVVNPPLRRGSKVHDAAFRALRDLGADSVRFVPWLPYPRLAVAELEPPRDGRTSWDFSLIDPLVSDFYEATAGRPVVLNFSTTPQWLWKTPEPVAYPTDPDQVTWTYTQGNELRDPTAAEVAAYYGRLASWYARGGFTDELGREHRSGHRFPIAYWEVLNEPDFEHRLTGPQYSRIYDAVVAAVRAVSPGSKFVGASLAHPRAAPAFFEHFLDPRSHAPGTPLDMISYHFYATPSADQPRETQGFRRIRGGRGLPDRRALHRADPRPPVAGHGHHGERGRHDRRPPLVRTAVDSGSVHARGFVTKSGRKLLLVNKRDRIVTVAVAGLGRASMAHVDGSTDGIGTREVSGEAVDLQPYAVAVMSIGP